MDNRSINYPGLSVPEDMTWLSASSYDADSDISNIPADWREGFIFNKNGSIANSRANIRLILENDSELAGIVYNELADDIEIMGDVPWKHHSRFWRDSDDVQLICYLDDHYGSFSKGNLYTVLSKITDDRSYHPVKDYFAALPEWDGTPRIDTMLIDLFGSDDTAYVRSVSRKIMCAAVMRVYSPGIKFDHILVLNGPQGIGKSTFISRLGMAWYSDSLAISDMNDKTSAEKLQGYWIIEIGELAGMRNVDIDKVKAFISRQDDKYRASYARRVTSHPRQCVFFGTTNAENGFLRDTTGNRRFWTVRVPGTGSRKPWDIEQYEIDQMWAEALHYAENEEDLFLPPELIDAAKIEQTRALEQDDREGLVSEYLELLLPNDWDSMSLYDRRGYIAAQSDLMQKSGIDRREYVSNIEIWCECFGKNKADMTRKDSTEINAIMEHIDGWQKSNKAVMLPLYGKQRIYQRTARNETMEQEAQKEQEQITERSTDGFVPPQSTENTGIWDF